MTGPLASLAAIEAYDGLAFDADLVAELWESGRGSIGKPFRAALPSFVSYESDEIEACSGGGAFPAFSITGGVCALNCAHCGGRILQPMIPARTPEQLETAVRNMSARQPLRGFLVSGGSNVRNEVRFEAFLPAVKRLKSELGLRVAVHTGLVDARRAAFLADAGIDVAMMDIIGAAETIRDVYNLDRPVADFESSLSELVAAGLDVVPHVVIGLHFGELLGEEQALDIIARHRTSAVILVVVMPHLAAPGRFRMPATSDVGHIFGVARRKLADRKLLLGCARPAGVHRRITDAYAVIAGLDGIAHPAPGSVPLARALGRDPSGTGACCGVDACRKVA